MINRKIARLFDRDKKHDLQIVLHGVVLRFYCDQKLPLTKIRRYLHYFDIIKKTGRGRAAHCMLTIMKEQDYGNLSALYAPQKKFEAFPGVEASFGTFQQYSAYEIKTSCLILVNNATNECVCIIKRSADRKIIQLDFIVHILLIEWLRGAGLFFIHASGICRGKKGYLFIGASGAGKTTSALMGVQRGLSFMGDDLIIVKSHGAGIKVHSYIEDVKFCLDMIGKFCELKKAKICAEAAKRRVTSMKFDVKKYFAVKIADNASVRSIFFLQEGNVMKKLRPQEALPLLMNNSFFYTRQDTSLKHFEILCGLIYSVDSYLVGRDYLNCHFDNLIA